MSHSHSYRVSPLKGRKQGVPLAREIVRALFAIHREGTSWTRMAELIGVTKPTMDRALVGASILPRTHEALTRFVQQQQRTP